MSKLTSNQVALFKASKAFNIVGIGQVLTGQIVEGEICGGDVMQLEVDGVTIDYNIDAVELVDYVSKGESEVGLIFDIPTTELQLILNSILGKTVIIVSS